MTQPKPKRPGPEPERVKVQGDPLQQFRKLLRPVSKKARAKPRKQGKRGR